MFDSQFLTDMTLISQWQPYSKLIQKNMHEFLLLQHYIAHFRVRICKCHNDRRMTRARGSLYTVMQKLRDKANKWLQLHSIWLWSNEQSSIGECRHFLWFLVKKSPAVAAVRYREVEKEVFRNDLCHPYSCCVVLNYLDAAFPKNRLDFLRHRFHTDFSTNEGKRFIYNLSSW